MDETLSDALLITVAGMGLVFSAILMIWLVIYLLVRFGSENDPVPDVDFEAQRERERKRQAAAIAIAIALHEQRDEPNVPPLPPAAIVSAWQAVMRQNQLQQRAPRDSR